MNVKRGQSTRCRSVGVVFTWDIAPHIQLVEESLQLMHNKKGCRQGAILPLQPFSLQRTNAGTYSLAGPEEL